MSEQGDALNKKALESGIIDQPPPIAVLLDDDAGERPELPWVQLPVDGRINSDFNREVGSLLAGKGLYRYKNRIVTVELNDKTNRVEIEARDAHWFRDWVENHMLCYKLVFNKHGATRVKQTMAIDTAATCLVSSTFQDKQARLLRVNPVQLPIQRADGRIELLPVGYDPESCILTLPQSWEYDENMTPDEARHILDDLDHEFPFQDPRSRAVFRAALFSQYGYFLQKLDAKKVNFLFHANSSRSGKTLLVEIVLAVAWGYANVEAFPEDTSKLRDRLDTAVRMASPYLVFDDLDQTFLRSGTLNSFMTASWWGGRKFHSQEDFQEPKTPVVFLTANNIEVAPDIAGRTLTCDLFMLEADTQDRRIEKPIDQEYIRTPAVHRQICSALWTLIRSWRDAGRPHSGRVVAGYQAWSVIFGGIVMNAGFEDPCQPRENDSFGNTEYADMLALISALSVSVEKAHEYEFAEIVDVCRDLNCFPNLLEGKITRAKVDGEEQVGFELTHKANSRFGMLLSRYGGKAFVPKHGKRVVFDKRGKNRHKRYIIQVTGSVAPTGS